MRQAWSHPCFLLEGKAELQEDLLTAKQLEAIAHVGVIDSFVLNAVECKHDSITGRLVAAVPAGSTGSAMGRNGRAVECYLGRGLIP
jgi:hypothetical protein